MSYVLCHVSCVLLCIKPCHSINNPGTISIQPLGGKMDPKLVYIVLEKELLDFSELQPRYHFIKVFRRYNGFYLVHIILGKELLNF